MCILNTSAEMFITWVVEHTRSVESRQFPTQLGYITLQQARSFRSKQSAFRLDMRGAYYYGLDADGTVNEVRHSESVIGFKVVSLDLHRIEVKGHYTQPAVRLYYFELLAEISKRWPEAYATIKQLLIESGAEALLATLQEPLAETHINALEVGLSQSHDGIVTSVKSEHSLPSTRDRGQPKRQTRSANGDTIDRIKSIAAYREDAIDKRGSTPPRHETCRTFHSDPRTLKARAPTLFSKWYQQSYIWKPEDDGLEEDMEF